MPPSVGDHTVYKELRLHQITDPALGNFFAAMYRFLKRLNDTYYGGGLPIPILSLSKDGSRRGHFVERDGLGLENRINLNPFIIQTGREAAEVAAHEQVHLWQALVGRPCLGNYHGEEFHAKVAELGILTDDRAGYHKGYVGDEWHTIMEANADLELDQFILPGMDAEPKRKMLRYECPSCGVSFRSRKKDLLAACGDCGVDFRRVK